MSLTALTTGPVAAQSAQNDVATLKGSINELAERVKISATSPAERPLPPVGRPILSWSNPERKTTAGGMFFWTDRGRPEAAMCIYPSEQRLVMEFQSLSLQNLVATYQGEMIWNPLESSIAYQTIADAPQPAASALRRLRQFRSIARRFDSRLAPPNRATKPLRLLPSPVYRYESDAKSSTSSATTGADRWDDGAIFCFVQGTDPETILILETAGTTWRYAAARMSMVPMQLQLDGQTVWSTDPNWAVSHINATYCQSKRTITP